MKPITSQKEVVIKSINDDQQIVFGEVYAPLVIDSHGETMTAEDVEAMAHNYVKAGNLGTTIDVMHDNNAVKATPVESFIARKDDPDYTEGAWVLGVHIEDPEVWESVKSGKLNGFSVQALAIKKLAVATIETYVDNVGTTEDADGHRHLYYVELDEVGKVVGGHTDIVRGHYHKISAGTRTDESEGHSHRYFL